MRLGGGARINGKNGSKIVKKVGARERQQIERLWDVPGDVTVNVDAGSFTEHWEGHYPLQLVPLCLLVG
jgi:hypothetical protein